MAGSARHLDVVAGPHDDDRMSLPPAGLSYEHVIESLDVAGLRARWSTDLGFAAVDPEVAEVTEAAARELIGAAKLTDVGGAVLLTDPVRTWLSAGALEIGGREVANGAMATPFTMLANLCWNPACSVPAGFSQDGLPIGLQIIGRRHADDVVMRLARVFEQARPWPRLAPPA